MVQKAYPGVYGGVSLAIYSKIQINVSFFCGSANLCVSWDGGYLLNLVLSLLNFWPMRTLITNIL